MNPSSKRGIILLDCGSSAARDLGDEGLLDVTLEKLRGWNVRVLKADSPFQPKHRLMQGCLEFLFTLIRCRVLWICCGGLFNDEKARLRNEVLLIWRKLIAVFFARLMLKPVYVDAQTVLLHGVLRPLFKFSFRGLTVNCRDDYSLEDCKRMGLKCERKKDLLIGVRPKPTTDDKRRLIAVDSRAEHCQGKLGDVVHNIVDKFHMDRNCCVYVVPTIHTSMDWKQSRFLFEVADVSVCVSFHAALFSHNAGVRTLCFYDSEYYRRKFSVLPKAEKYCVK